jgi:CheY-like chemotaxis protein
VVAVDDDQITLQVIGALLVSAGADVRTAASGPEALEMVRADAPDVLLSDLYMPGMDGFTLLRRLRERPESEGGRTPAVAVTAQPSFESRKAATEAGYQDLLPKPFGREHLIRIVLAAAARIETEPGRT